MGKPFEFRTVDHSGRVTIPAQWLKEIGVKPGEQVELVLREEIRQIHLGKAVPQGMRG